MLEKKADLEERDLGKQPLSEAELDALIGNRSHLDYLNTKNELYPRNTPLGDDRAYYGVMEINGKILARMRSIGGKSYPPYAPYFSQAEWEQHYGPETWRRLAAAKREYDSNLILTPEMCMFDGRSGG